MSAWNFWVGLPVPLPAMQYMEGIVPVDETVAVGLFTTN